VKKIVLIITTALTVATLLTAFCKGKAGEAGQAYMGEMANDPALTENNVTKLVRVDDLHVAFDFMSMPYHMQMMKLMGAEMKHIPGATHGLMVTVMSYETKKILKDAEVSLSVTDPEGRLENYTPEVMQGAGMHHYAIHLKAAKQGAYQVSARVRYHGKDYLAKTEFTGK